MALNGVSEMSDTDSKRQWSAWLPATATLVSILSCYGTLGIIAALSLMGVTIVLNVHVWAAVIVAFALAAVVGLALGCRRHGRTIPLGLAIVGALLVIGSMYGPQGIRAMLGVPSQAVELIGFVSLIAAAVWDWRL